jgi:hypothetical protein
MQPLAHTVLVAAAAVATEINQASTTTTTGEGRHVRTFSELLCGDDRLCWIGANAVAKMRPARLANDSLAISRPLR